MSGRNRILFLGAGLFTVLAACHQARPASTVLTPNTAAEQIDPERSADPSSRDLMGTAPDAAPPAHRVTTKPVTRPLSPPVAPDAASPDDPMRQFDMP